MAIKPQARRWKVHCDVIVIDNTITVVVELVGMAGTSVVYIQKNDNNTKYSPWILNDNGQFNTKSNVPCLIDYIEYFDFVSWKSILQLVRKELMCNRIFYGIVLSMPA